jgi:hypothetical protein
VTTIRSILLLFPVLLLGFGATDARREIVEIQARRVNLRLENGIVVEISFLRGSMEPVDAGKPVSFDDPKSFQVRASFARIGMSTQALANVMNRYAFAYEGSPLKDIAVETHGRSLRIKGTIHKGVGVSFSMEGRPEPDGKGGIRLHADKVSAAHVPLKGLLHLFGEDLAKLVNTNEARGVRIEGDDIILFPARLTPPPHLLGNVTHVDIEGDRIIETFGSPGSAPLLKPPRKVSNYVYHRGGVLKFGKLTMTDVDLEIVDMEQNDPFDFFLADYNRQLVGGYSKNTLQHGLIVYMPDYGRIAPAGR